MEEVFTYSFSIELQAKNPLNWKIETSSATMIRKQLDHLNIIA
jgi:hypothetical protein